jgi:acyl dehydratase
MDAEKAFERFSYHAPVVVGDRLTFRSQVSDVVDKKGGALTIVNVATEVINQHDHKVAEAVRSIVIRN